MRRKEYIGPITNISEKEYYKRLADIQSQCNDISVFEFEGRFFSGSIVGTARAYIKENPSESFFVWLINNGLEVRYKD